MSATPGMVGEFNDEQAGQDHCADKADGDPDPGHGVGDPDNPPQASRLAVRPLVPASTLDASTRGGQERARISSSAPAVGRAREGSSPLVTTAISVSQVGSRGADIPPNIAMARPLPKAHNHPINTP